VVSVLVVAIEELSYIKLEFQSMVKYIIPIVLTPSSASLVCQSVSVGRRPSNLPIGESELNFAFLAPRAMVNSEVRLSQEGMASIFERSGELVGMSLLVVPCML